MKHVADEQVSYFKIFSLSVLTVRSTREIRFRHERLDYAERWLVGPPLVQTNRAVEAYRMFFVIWLLVTSIVLATAEIAKVFLGFNGKSRTLRLPFVLLYLTLTPRLGREIELRRLRANRPHSE
jgi:hypothetical protein